MELVTQIIQILIAGLSEFATGFFGAMGDGVSAVFMVTEGDTTKMSNFGIIICVFASISLCVGMTRWITSFVTSLGN